MNQIDALTNAARALEGQRDSYRDAYQFWKSYQNGDIKIDGRRSGEVFEQVRAERDRFREMLERFLTFNPGGFWRLDELEKEARQALNPPENPR